MYFEADQHSQAFSALAGSTKPKTPMRDNGYQCSGYQHSLLTQIIFIRLCARSHKRGRLTRNFRTKWTNPVEGTGRFNAEL